MLKEESSLKIKASGELFIKLFEYMSSGVAIYEAINNGNDFIFKDFNSSAEKIDKIDRKNIIGKSILKVFPEVKDFGLFSVLQKVYRTGISQKYPLCFYKDNRISGWRRNNVYKLPSGEIVVIYDDMTRQKRVEESLRLSEEFGSSLMKNSPTPVMVLNVDYSIRYANSALEKLFGYKLSSILGKKPPFPWWPKEMSGKYGEILKEVPIKIIRHHSLPVLTMNGKTRYLDVTAAPVKSKGKLRYLLINYVDITERKKAEEEKDKNETNLKEAQGIAHIGSFNLDLISNKISISDELYRIFNINPRKFDGNYNSIMDLFHPEDKESARINMGNAIDNKKLLAIEFRMLLKDNIEIYIDVMAKPFYDESDRPSRVIGTVMDITKRKKSEQ
ncbi:MAG: PAS domain S-box protein, partial [Actinobacteria bacterium]|nr:PAS domain S-box protein [Actinomycetota bacterium]